LINVDKLDEIFPEGAEVTPESLSDCGVISGRIQSDGIKILGRGELNKNLTVKAHKFSRKAKEKIEEAGGEAINLE
jgi:large subunit ribosomal protein L15